MSLITASIPNLSNGVSQQPDILRLASQGDEQLNGLSSVVDGLVKRPPSEWKAKIVGVTEDAFFHVINRDAVERYVVSIEDGTVKVYDLDGNERLVNFPDGFEYLQSTAPKETFQCVTVADYTFVLNKEKVVQESPNTTPERDPEALVWVKQGSYGSIYRIYINGTEAASYSVPDGSTASHANDVTTSAIAQGLSSSFSRSGFSIQRYGSTLRITEDNGDDFNIRGDSPVGDEGMLVIKESVQRFSELPSRGVNGFTVEVAGDSSSSFDNYYVKFEADGGSGSPGVWKETVKEEETYQIDGSSMPHALVRETNGDFTFRQVDWIDRQVGDSESAPFPSFVGRRIKDIFFYRNRLGMAADENIIMSTAGDFFNFFRGTATTTLDSDPIDVGISHVKVSLIEQVVPFNQTLLMFSNQTQFQTGDAQVLTAETVSINPTTEYECSLKAKPVGIGKNIYFATNHGNFSGVREYFVDEVTESEQAQEVTGHVPKYIQGEITRLAASSSEDILIALTDETPEIIYVYKFYYSDTNKLQASWSKWKLGGEGKVLDAHFIESDLHLLTSREDGIHLETVNMSSEVTETDWNFRILLDSKVSESQVSVTERTDLSSSTGEVPTEVDLPYLVSNDDDIILVTGPDGAFSEGVVLVPSSIDNSGATSKLIFNEDLTNQRFYVGRKYAFRYRLSDLIPREDTRNGGQIAVKQGRLQLRRASAYVARTGYLRAEVTPYNRQTYEYVYTGNVIGSAATVIGQISITDGKMTFPIMSKNDNVDIELVNDTHLPSSILSIDWEGFYINRAQRV